MEYTEGERLLYCGVDYWFVLIKDKPNRPDMLVGKFRTKEDALLDAAAPEMYEAIKHFIEVTKKAKGIEFTPSMHGAWIALNESLAKTEVKSDMPEVR